MEPEVISTLVATITQTFLGTLFSKFEWFIVSNKEFKQKCELIKEKITENIASSLESLLNDHLDGASIRGNGVHEPDKAAKYSINTLKGSKYFIILERYFKLYKILTFSLLLLSLSGVVLVILLLSKVLTPYLILYFSIASIVMQGAIIIVMHTSYNKLDDVDEKFYG